MKRVALALEAQTFDRRHDGHVSWRDRLDIYGLQADKVQGLAREPLLKRCITHQCGEIAARGAEKEEPPSEEQKEWLFV